jgi:hypothetical protein
MQAVLADARDSSASGMACERVASVPPILGTIGRYRRIGMITYV